MGGWWKFISEHWDLLILLALAALVWSKFETQNEVMISLIMSVMGAFLFEKYYISRGAVLLNVLVIYFIFTGVVLPELLNIYLLGGVSLGIVSLYCYASKIEMPGWVYSYISYPLYGLKTILAFYVTYLILGLNFDILWGTMFLVSLITIWVFAVKRADNDPPFGLTLS